MTRPSTAAPAARRQPSRLARLATALGLAAAAYGAIAGWVYWQQESLLFHPQPLPADFRFDVPGDVEEVRIDVPGASLSGLHLRLPKPKGVVFFLHGNDGNLASWFTNTEFYRAANYDLFMLDYRGFGKSTGRIESEAQLMADVRAAWETVAGRYSGLRRVIYGRSLGTGPAAELAAAIQPDLTVLVSPYCSMAEMAETHYPFLPTALVRYPLATCDVAPRIGGPLLLIHGDQDTLIPVIQSEHIRTHAPRAELVVVPGAGHVDLHQFDHYQDLLARRLGEL